MVQGNGKQCGWAPTDCRHIGAPGDRNSSAWGGHADVCRGRVRTVSLLLARTTKNEESPGAIRGARVDESRTCAAATAGRRQGSPQARCRRGEPGPPELLRRGGVGASVAGLSRPDRVPIIFEIIHKVNVRHLSIFRSWTQGTLLETDTGS
jgi:hypothetical protein